MTDDRDPPISLKARLGRGGILVAPGVYDALTASLASAAGFEALYLSGAAIAYTKLGRPDIGLVSSTEVAETLAYVRERVETPVIVDADTGYGNALNVQRTVRLFERAGASAIQLEDQTFPKRCGHLAEKRVIFTREMAARDGGLEPGDNFLFNDPYDGGTHLNDFRLVRPVFRGGALFCWLASVGHWLDIGGNVPGGFNARATDTFQEGVRIPSVKLISAGRVNPDIVAILDANSRVPQSNHGDLIGQLKRAGPRRAKTDRAARRLRRGCRRRSVRGFHAPGRGTDAREYLGASRWPLQLRGLSRQRRGRRRTTDDRT